MPRLRPSRRKSVSHPRVRRSNALPGWWLWLVPVAALAVIGALILLQQESGHVDAGAKETASPRRALRLPRVLAGRLLTGPATVHDGDTITVAGARIRLHGIDAPETDQPCQRQSGQWHCGREASGRLRALIAGKEVRCTPLDTDRYGRTVARCEIGGMDIQAWMVRNGWATAYTRYSKDYLPQQRRAQIERLGIWQGESVTPEAWRHSSRRGRSLEH